MRFEKGTLWNSLVAVSERALRSGALQPIRTEDEFLRDHGVDFLVRIVANLKRKVEDKSPPAKERRNPFLPYDPELHVADASDTHACLLNKYNVVAHHLLVVTKQFEDQRSLLTHADFTALWSCLSEYDSLGFYNCGETAGASQPHKHLQVVPLPLAARGPAIPIEPLIELPASPSMIGRSPVLPFAHAVARLDPGRVDDAPRAGEAARQLYCRLLETAGIDPSREPLEPYNLLLTRQWMLLVPRSRERFQSISLNALAFAGALLVRDRVQLELLSAAGPMHALTHVSNTA